MRHPASLKINLVAIAAAFAFHTMAYADDVPAGYVDFGKFNPSKGGGEFVEVNVKSNLIAMVARLAAVKEPEVADLLRGLHMVRVNVIQLKDDNRQEIQDRVATIRKNLDAAGWERIVTAQQAKQDVGVYVKTRGQEAFEGVVVTVIEGDREAVLVNIVGDINPDKIALIGEKLNIEPLKKVGESTKKS